jgi:uncharacterized protein (TIGR02466 family)
MKHTIFLDSILVFQDNSWLNSLNKFSENYIIKSKDENKKRIINNKEFGFSNHSIPLINDENFLDFIKFICKKSFNFLEEQGYDLSNYYLNVSDLWVQEFAKNGGGNHNTHVHSNSHISGFYFLKCSDKTSYPIFHDPRPGKLTIQLPEKNKTLITEASELVPLFPSPGTFVFFNSYVGHEFPVDSGIEPFRFIHFNIQALPKQLINGNYKKINDSKNSSSDSLF